MGGQHTNGDEWTSVASESSQAWLQCNSLVKGERKRVGNEEEK